MMWHQGGNSAFGMSTAGSVAVSLAPRYQGGGMAPVRLFSSATQCREELGAQTVPAITLVCEYDGDVAPINLAAALCHDNAGQEVYLVASEPTGSLQSRAYAAGVREVVGYERAEEIVRATLPTATVYEPTPAGSQEAPLESCAPGAPFEAAAPAPAVIDVPPVKARAVTPPHLPSGDELLRAATAAMREPAAPAGEGLGDVYAFVSGRGGVGKSCLSVLCAELTRRRGLRVALLDLDLQLGDLEYLIGEAPDEHVRVISLPAQPSAAAIPRILAGDLCLVHNSGRPEAAEEAARVVPALIRILRGVADVVFVNTGSFWSELQPLVAEQCKQLLVCMDQRATSVRGARTVAELCVRCGCPATRLTYVLNRCGRQGAISIQDAQMALGGGTVLAVADGGAMVEDLLASGHPRELAASKSAIVPSLERLLDYLEVGCAGAAPGAPVAAKVAKAPRAPKAQVGDKNAAPRRRGRKARKAGQGGGDVAQ